VLADIHRVYLVVGHDHGLIGSDNLHVLADHALFNLRGAVQLLE
jgi:hypothetical protein